MKEQENPPPGSIDKTEREELIRLRREVRRLKMEAEIVKKAMVFFARDQK